MKSLDNSKAVVLFSGGMDSTCALHKAYLDYGKVIALSILYGQRHSKEVDAADEIAGMIGVEHKILDLSHLGGVLAGSALTSPLCEVPKGHYEDASMKATVVPNRNMIFLAIAGGFAISKGYGDVVIANHAGDHVIYPDCRLEFIDEMRRAFAVCHYQPVQIVSPFVDMTKAQLLSHCVGEGFIDMETIALTWSCYEDRQFHCGLCGTCVERKEAIAEVVGEDPTPYWD